MTLSFKEKQHFVDLVENWESAAPENYLFVTSVYLFATAAIYER
jgi:hypothetical protein